MMKRLLIALALLAAPLWADGPIVQNIGPFAGLNDQDSSLVIPAANAQDLLNVDITPGGRSVKKRHGFGLDATLTYSTSTVHGGYHFFDASGNDIRLWSNDTIVSASVNNAAYAVIVSSNHANGTTMSCADSQGLAWCVTSAQDQVFRTNGVTVSWFPSLPQGSEITVGPDRLAIANTASNPNTINFSASGDFTNFTPGSQPTSPFAELILAPGSHLTHVRYWNGRYLWWKDQSFGYVILNDQFNLNLVVVSYLIGTYDNASVENEGIIYFRGQDNHIWAYDGAVLTRLTREITPLVNADNKRKSNLWTQTSQADFAAGASSQTVTLSTAIVSGSVTVATFTATDSTTANFNAGTTNNTTVASNSIALSTNNSGTVGNPDFESTPLSSFWTAAGTSPPLQKTTSVTPQCGISVSAQSGSNYILENNSTLTSRSQTFKILDKASGSTLYSTAITDNEDCTWRQVTITDTADTGKRVQFRWELSTSPDGPSDLTTVSSYIFGGSLTFYYISDQSPGGGAELFIDNIALGSSTITTGSFASQGFDTGVLFSYVEPITTWSVNTATPSFVLQKGTSTTGGWTDVGTSTGTSYAVNQRYVRYLSTFTITGTDSALSTLTSVTLIAASSGTYYSAVNNAPNLTSWNTLGVTDSVNGNSSIAYFTRASTSIFTVSSATPTWVAQTKSATVAASTGTYMQMRADFITTAATETPTLNDFTFNWYEGSAGDQAYGTYFDFGIWWSVSFGASATTNNRILRYDLLNQTWTVYDIPANGFLTQNNLLYFGSTTAGKIFSYANGAESDNGAAINAYWQSKDYTNVGTGGPTGILGYNPADSPFVKKDYRTLSTFVSSQSTGTLTVTYQTDRVGPLAYSFNLLDPNGLLTTHHNYNLPFGTKGYAMDVKFGNNAANQPFELLGASLSYLPGSYYPYP